LRDARVFALARRLGVPIVVTLGGGYGRDIEAKIHALEEKSRAVAEAAGRAFPPPEAAGLPAAPPPSGEGSRPIVPDVKPNWEQTTDAAGG
ncbi:MAG: hypothetical protein ACK4YP_28175, partial [Myxococcota bacterium]